MQLTNYSLHISDFFNATNFCCRTFCANEVKRLAQKELNVP